VIKNKLDLSLIIPCYNEEPHLEINCRKIIWILDNLKINFEIILIDDCSHDQTKKIISKLIGKDPKNIKAIFHEQNIGRGGTVNEGLKVARGAVAGFLDIDLEVSEQYIPSFYWKIIEGNDMVIAKRSYEFTMAKLIRYLASKGYSFLVRHILKSPFNDTEAGYKFFNRQKILPVLNQMHDQHWFWDTEIVMRSFSAGLKITEVPVIFIRDPNKKSTVKVIPDSILYLKNLIKFKKEKL
jgi:glycosyltransferase involved in cell wall biosynthesis